MNPSDPKQPEPSSDPNLDALLNQALQTGAPAPAPDLADRIYRKTRPMLRQPTVLARTGPTLLRVAAVIALIVGGTIVLTLIQQPDTATNLVENTDQPDSYDFTAIEPDLEAIAQAMNSAGTPIDQQLDVLSLRVDWVSVEDPWDGLDRGTDELIDEAVVRFEMDLLADSSAYFITDEQAVF